MKVIAVDVGTTSVRLAIIEFSGDGHNEAHVIASRDKDITLHQDGVFFEQSSSEIWQAICDCSLSCLEASGLNPNAIKSIAFSSTCSLVILDEPPVHYPRDIIMWMDHRAIEEATEVTLGKSRVLDQFGGVCSPEFSLSKLLWLKKHQPQRLAAARAIFELPDWLVYQCIRGDPKLCPRSLCTLTCKWGYDAVLNKHCDIVETLESELKYKLGQETLKPGTIAGTLSTEAAKELGLITNTSAISNKENVASLNITVATSLIDAHSGMLAMLSVPLKKYGIELSIESTFCSLAGTSSCHMLLSERSNFTAGIWGPYKDVVLDGYSLLEAGQSLTGKLIELCIETSHEGKRMLSTGNTMKEIIQDLNCRINDKHMANELHVLPTYHGSRSPLANPRLKGGIYGLTAGHEAGLLDLYVATVESIVFELKTIIEVLGIKLSAILVSGGLMKNRFYMQTLADVLDCKVVKMSLENIDFMVMGSGLTARCAALNLLSVPPLQGQKGQPLRGQSIEDIDYGQLAINIYEPNKNRKTYLSKKYSCYKEFVDFSLRVDNILNA